MNSNKRKLVNQYKIEGLTPKQAYDKMMLLHKAGSNETVGKRKQKRS